jgi:nucleotide-binding universal stress UspA family protein
MFKHLLVPTDGSALSQSAVQLAVTLAAENKARLTALHVIPEYHVFAYGPEMIADTEERFLYTARQHADDYLEAVKAAAASVGVDCETMTATRTHPYEAIIGVASQHKCDLIVMASHGRRGVSALLLGSETQKVLTHSDIPVLVVRSSMTVKASRARETGASNRSQQSTMHQLPRMT